MERASVNSRTGILRVAWLKLRKRLRFSLLHDLIDAYSGNPEGDNTMLMMSLMREVFMIRSLGVVWDREGDAFT